MLEKVKDLSAQSLKVLVVLQDLSDVEFAHLLAEALAGLGEDVSLQASVHVVLDVDGVLLGDLHEHTDVILVVRILLLIWMEQMLVLF